MTGYSFAFSTLGKIPMPLNPAAPTKLILCQPLGDGRRLLIEIATDDAVTATPWDGARQVGDNQLERLLSPSTARIVGWP